MARQKVRPAVGEVIFNTAIVDYQERITDGRGYL
ncbi:MAG: hypothetical protein NC912_03190 [Candidatus Omnitrophica bacterium]|nr:hypothetical protein [Candidatus Omnitrophota bacterium]